MIILIAVIVMSILFINNQEHYAKYRFSPVEKIVVKWIYNGDGSYCMEGYKTYVINDKDEIKRWRTMLYDVQTDGRWFSFDDGPPGWEVFFEIEVFYEDGYVETIECTTGTRAMAYDAIALILFCNATFLLFRCHRLWYRGCNHSSVNSKEITVADIICVTVKDDFHGNCNRFAVCHIDASLS